MQPQPSAPNDTIVTTPEGGAERDALVTDAANELSQSSAQPRESPNGSDEATDDAVVGDSLSPAVRRLVRQYDLNVAQIRGTGPDGRIRVGDVMAVIGTRADAPRGSASDDSDDAPARRTFAKSRELERPRRAPDAATGQAEPAGRGGALAANDEPAARAVVDGSDASAALSEPASRAAIVVPVTTVFECDLGRALAHRKRHAQHGVEPTLTSYYLVACAVALERVPEVGVGTSPEIGLWLATSDGDAKALLVDIAAEPPGTPATERVQGVDLRIRAAATAAANTAAPDGAASPDSAAADPFAGAAMSLLVHQHGASGSLLATATPLHPGHAASLGIGRVRKQIAVRSGDGDDGARVAALAYVTLSFDPSRVTLQRANRFMAELVRVLEHWPSE